MSAGFRHDMPFGAAVAPDGGPVTFRLWAPAQEQVTLVIGAASDTTSSASGRAPETEVAMARTPDGWVEARVDRARAPVGSAYCFALADGFRVPDPAARAQVHDVHGPSLVVDPEAYRWQHPTWAGRAWEETVLYELHIGCFDPERRFDAVRRRLDHLCDLGVTAIQLMPVADFPGARNWGYDGVLPYAPDRSYGSPDELKRLIDEAHGRDLMVFLDVVYNHFGPDGNYLHLYAPDFFADHHRTPWGAAIDFTRPQVRAFFIHNALYWVNEFRVDGLRLDAVHAIADVSPRHILDELAETVHAAVSPGRRVHLVLENDLNQAARLVRRDGDPATPVFFTAQWNDDFHHACHVLATDETVGYYADFAEAPTAALARALAEGFIYQGEASPYRGHRPRGTPSADLPPTAFVTFLQNHDQIGNRAFGERLTRLAGNGARRALTAILLLAPSIPLLFMGEEWDADTPFLYFCDFRDELAVAVREGRRREFQSFPAFAEADARALIPDPNAEGTFQRSCLRWPDPDNDRAKGWLWMVRELLRLRRTTIMPRLAGMTGGQARILTADTGGLALVWTLGDGSTLHLRANLSNATAAEVPPPPPGAPMLFETRPGLLVDASAGILPAWSTLWVLEPSVPGGSAP